MRTAAIAYRNKELRASEQGGLWTVRLANLEVRARYLDLALAQLLGNAPEAHRAAARLLSELAEVVEQQRAAYPRLQSPTRQERPRPRPKVSAQPLLLALRVLAFAVVASTAFMLTTWLTTLR